MTISEKVEYLVSKGWYTFRSPNNWFHDELMDDINLDSGGIRLEDAYSFAVNSGRIKSPKQYTNKYKLIESFPRNNFIVGTVFTQDKSEYFYYDKSGRKHFAPSLDLIMEKYPNSFTSNL